MEIAHSRNGVSVRLTDERWRHIVSRHPEMRWQRHRVLEAIASPDLVQRGDYGALLALRHYNQPPAADRHRIFMRRSASGRHAATASDG